jgi:hypothetical protein
MQAELATWRPLWDFAAVLFVLGSAGSLSCRDRTSWWIAQALLLLSTLVGWAACQVTHAGVDFFPLGVWIPLAWIIVAWSSWRGRRVNE